MVSVGFTPTVLHFLVKVSEVGVQTKECCPSPNHLQAEFAMLHRYAGPVDQF